MKLSFSREALLKPLQMVIGVVDRKQAMPMLSNVLLDINEKLSIVGTDLEIQLTGHSNLNKPLSAPVKLTLPGRKLLDICRALPENSSIELYQEKQQIILRSQRSRFTLSTLPPEEYPNTETLSPTLQLKLNQPDLLMLLQKTHFAMAQQDVRYYLNGMLFEFVHHGLRAIATDGHRLAFNSLTTPANNEGRIQVIVPRKGILELMKLLSSQDQEINLSVGNNYIQATAENFSFVSKLVEGKFPDYQRVIPKSGDKQVIVNREDFKQALIRSAILCHEKVRGIFLELKPQLLRILANNAEQEMAEEELTVDYSGPEMGLAFNVNYLLDVLNILSSTDVQLVFSSANNNSLLLQEPNSQKEQAFVIMPMRM